MDATVAPPLSRRTAVRLGGGGIIVALVTHALAPVAAQDTLATEENTAIVRRLFEEAINDENLAVFDKLIAPNFIDRTPLPGQTPVGPAGIKAAARDLHAMFPDLRVVVAAIIAEGDLVAARVTWHGTHTPANQPVTGTTLHIWRLANGKIVEGWSAGWEWLSQVDGGQATPAAAFSS